MPRPPQLTPAPGHDHLTFTDSDETLAGLTAPVTVNGAGNADLTLDDSKATVSKTTTITASTITALSAGTVTYNNLGTLQIDLGSGDDAVYVQGTATGTTTTISGNSRGQTFNVANAAGWLPP